MKLKLNKEDWQEKKLEEVCEILNGGTPKTNIKEYWNGDILWITSKDMGKIKNKFVSNTERKITQQGLNKCSSNLLPINSVILSSRAPIGRLAINTKKMCTNQGCKGLILKKNFNFKFLYYFLLNSVDLLNKLGSGTTFKEISTGKLSTIKIFVPSLSEQQQIVNYIDSAFEEVDQLKTKTQENLIKTDQLWQSILNEELKMREGWQTKEFNNCLKKVIYTSKIKNNKYLTKGVYPIISQEKNTINGYWNKKEDLFEITKPVIIFGDHTKIIKYIDFNFVLGADGVKILDAKDFLNSKYLFYFLNSITLENLGYARHYRLLKKILVPIPSLSEQQQIVTKLDSIYSDCQKLKNDYQKIVDNCEELKKSILNDIFSLPESK